MRITVRSYRANGNRFHAHTTGTMTDMYACSLDRLVIALTSAMESSGETVSVTYRSTIGRDAQRQINEAVRFHNGRLAYG